MENGAQIRDTLISGENSRDAISIPRRGTLIARFGRLRVFNGFTIHLDERLRANKCYINLIVAQIPGFLSRGRYWERNCECQSSSRSTALCSARKGVRLCARR